MNTIEQIGTDFKKNKYQIAINLRLLGFTYRQIAENPQINAKEHTIRTWFMKDGICYNDYKLILNNRLEEYQELFQNLSYQLRDISIDAINTIRQAVRNGNVNASFKVLNLIFIQNYVKYENPRSEGVELLRKVVKSLEEDAKKRRDAGKNIDPNLASKNTP